MLLHLKRRKPVDISCVLLTWAVRLTTIYLMLLLTLMSLNMVCWLSMKIFRVRLIVLKIRT